MGGDHTSRDCDRIAAGVAQNEAFMKNEVGFPGRNCHFEDYVLVAGAQARRRS
jgi:hypothetical protein